MIAAVVASLALMSGVVSAQGNAPGIMPDPALPSGKTPVLPAARLYDLGFRLAAYPMVPFGAAIHAMQQSLAAMRAGTEAMVPEASFEEIKRVVGFPGYYALEKRFAGPVKDGR